MAIRCGFFNSVGQDRLYSAEDMNEPYKALVSNGVFATQKGTPSDYLQVVAQSGLTVKVKAGRGIFGDKWFLSDSDISLTLNAPNVTLSRIDSIVVRIDRSESVRNASIIVRTGVASSSPVAPEMFRDDYVTEYRLADIKVNSGATAISQSNITDMRGSADCGWVTSLIQQVDTSTLYIQWQTAFDEWFKDVKETLSTSTLIRSYESTYTTSVQDETAIPINIPQFNQNLDILQVYINGLLLIKGVEYAIADNSKITLTNGVDTGTPVSFVVYKSIDGSDAESVVQQVYDLQTQVNGLMNADPQPLYTSDQGVYLNNGQTVTPTKRLSACRGGWVLIWTVYGTNTYVQTTMIPKKSFKNATWSGEHMTVQLVGSSDGTTTTMAVKSFRIYDDRILAHVDWNSNNANKVIGLRAIYEY